MLTGQEQTEESWKEVFQLKEKPKDFFVELARADRSGGKNIEYGNVKIQRPGRSGGIVEEVLVESVYYVKEKFYSNKVAKIKKQLLALSHEMDVDDLRGNLEKYCMFLWTERNKKWYNAKIDICLLPNSYWRKI